MSCAALVLVRLVARCGLEPLDLLVQRIRLVLDRVGVALHLQVLGVLGLLTQRLLEPRLERLSAVQPVLHEP